jgi:peptidyl-prolyl cis-trans isomerase C
MGHLLQWVNTRSLPLSSLPPNDGEQDERREPVLDAPEPVPVPDPQPGTEPYSELFTREEVERSLAEQHDEPTDADPTKDDGVPAAVPGADEEEVEEPVRRPPFGLIAVSALLLIAIGVGIGYAFAPRPTPVADPLAVTPAAVGELPTPFPTPDLPRPVDTIPDSEVIASVNDKQITFGEFKQNYTGGEDPAETLKQMMQVELVVQAALAEGATIDESRVDSQIEEIKLSQAGGDDAQFLAFLQQNNIASIDALRELLGRQQLIEAAMRKHTLLEQARARHILLSATEDKLEERKAEAEELLKQVQDGGDFAALAKEKSEDPGSKDNGGDLGWAPRGMFVPEFDAAIFEMEKDEIRLISTQFGWHIIQLVEPAEVREVEDQQIIQTPAGQEAFTTTFLPWVEKLMADGEAAGTVKRLVDPATLVTKPT